MHDKKVLPNDQAPLPDDQAPLPNDQAVLFYDKLAPFISGAVLFTDKESLDLYLLNIFIN